jgi:hypothetical protein
MIGRPSSPFRRAARLLRFYPPAWRERYGDEFCQLLIDEFEERPRSWARTADVARSGLLARLAHAGLAGDLLDADQQRRASLAALGWSLAAFFAFGIAVWSQLTIGWQWSAPAVSATRAGMVVMSIAVLAIIALALLSALPILSALVVAALRDRGRALARPLALTVAGLATLILGSVHFGHGWPGTGGHPWADRGLVPAEVARFCWAATLWISSYWAHPGALGAFPTAEIAWMLVSPIALFAFLRGVAGLLRGLQLSRRVLWYEARLGIAGAAAMAVFLAGSACWIVSGGPSPRGLFRTGAIDALGLVVMAAALVLGFRASTRAVATRPRRQTPT